MANDVQRTRNTQNEINRFDNMSIDDIDDTGNMKPAEAPSKRRSSGDEVTPYTAKPKVEKPPKEKQPKVSKVSAFRPVENLDKDNKFRADKKPSLESQPKPKKKVPVKALIAVAGVLVVGIGTYSFVPVVNKSVNLTLTGSSKYILQCEEESVTSMVQDISGVVGKFSKLTTDNAFSGTAEVNVLPACENVYVKPVLVGNYKGDYELVTAKGTDNLTCNLTFNDYNYGDFTIINSYSDSDHKLYLQPYGFEGYFVMPHKEYYQESSNFGIAYTDEYSSFINTVYGGVDITSLVTLLSSEEMLIKMLEPYKTIFKEAAFKYSFDFDTAELPEGVKADVHIVGKASWADIKPTVDALIQQAKSDKEMDKIISASGLSRQSYLDILNDVSTKLNELYSSAGESAEFTIDTYLYKDKVVMRKINIPSGVEKYCTVSMLTTDMCKEFLITEDGDTSKHIKLTLDSKEQGYTGKLYIDTGKPVIAEFTNLVLGDAMTGDLTVTKGSNVLDVNFTTEPTQQIKLMYSSEGKEYVNAQFSVATSSVADTKENTNTKLELLGGKSNEKNISDFVDKNINEDEWVAYYQNTQGIDLDITKFKENVCALLQGYNTKTYDITMPNTDVSTVYVDSAALLQEALDKANENARVVANAAEHFVIECSENPNNKYEIIDGVYTGFVEAKQANMSYAADFDTKNLEACLACSIDPGYYCFVLKNGTIAYAFWSETEDFQVRVANRDLPSHFEDITSIEEVKGSYPTISTVGE